jgi:hypothetical protein
MPIKTDPYPHELGVLFVNLRGVQIIFALFYGRFYLVGLFKINQIWALLLFVKFVIQPRSIKGQSQKWLSTTGWRTKWHSSITTYSDILLYFDYVLKKWW